MSTDDNYTRIGKLTDEYLDLNVAFIEAIRTNKSAAERVMLKKRIKNVLEEIERLEAERAGTRNDKGELPGQ